MAFEPNLAYEASAGSGKTFNLVVRYLSLLFMDVDVEKIMALTFTNKAANEMQERVIATLRDLETRNELSAISEVTGLEKSELLAKRPRLYARFLNARNRIMTIDAFFASILRRFALHAGLMPTFTTFERQHELRLMIRFLSRVSVAGKDETLIDLSLLASKRLASIFELLHQLYAKSAELQHVTLQPVDAGHTTAEAMGLLQELRGLFSFDTLSQRAQKTLDIADMEALTVASWMSKESMNYWDFRKQFTPQMDLILSALKRCAKIYMQHKEQRFFQALFELLDIYKQSRLDLAKNENELSFDDITVLVYHLLKERIESDFLYFRLDSKIEHLLLDEFQDTSVVQFDILRPIIEEILSGKGVNELGSFFFVGDVKQSIYRFRGGVSALFGEVARHYDVTLLPLVTNYRSQREIVTFVNRMFENRIAGYLPQKVRDGAEEGYVEVIEDESLLEQCVSQVVRLMSEGAQSGNIAILCATNADGAAIEEVLRSHRIDVVTETTSKLIHQPLVMAIIEYLKYCYYGAAIYRANFFALLELEAQTLERCNSMVFDLHRSVVSLIERFGIFRGDLNVLRFLDLLSHFEDIEAFLFEYERMDASAVQTDLIGVRVLTVHKSKGLEFRHVIVLDRLGRPKGDSAPIIYDYEGTHLQGIYLRQENRAAFDPAYAQALEREAQARHEDALNALYVAFTRAEHTLIIIKKEKLSKFDLLNLEAGSYGMLQIPASSKVQTASEAMPVYTPRHYGRQGNLIEYDDEMERDYHAITFGLALHYTLEMMETFSESALEAAMKGTYNRYGALLESSALERLQRRIMQTINHDDFIALTDGICYKEQPISYQGELRYLDLLVQHEGRWVILDYKSGMHHHDLYVEQVSFYKEALRDITEETVEAYLCYLLDDGLKLVRV